MSALPLDVIAISRSRGVAVLSDGNQARVESWHDEDGDHCDAADAVCALVPVSDGIAVVVDLTDFAVATYH